MVKRKPHDSIGRRNRMKPQSSGKRIRLTDRDLLWMHRIHELGPLSTPELLAFSDDGKQNRGRAQNRLTDLFNEENTPHGGRYLDRPSQQFKDMDARYKPAIYSLQPAAEKALKEAGLWSDHVHKAGGPFWHQRLTSRSLASVAIAAKTRDDIGFIPGSTILARAQTKLRYQTRITDPSTNQTIDAPLVPDGLFGLEYRQDETSYRFFVIEADRSTEPKNTGVAGRKSINRMLAQYYAYLDRGLYKDHLKLTAPMIVLVVLNELGNRTKPLSEAQSDRLLFTEIDDDAENLLGRAWHRPRQGELRIDQP